MLIYHLKLCDQDGYTKEVTGSEGVRVLVAKKAKPNQDVHSPLDREFFISFLDVSVSEHPLSILHIEVY